MENLEENISREDEPENQISAEQLKKIVEKLKPPQKWYEGSEEDLFNDL